MRTCKEDTDGTPENGTERSYEAICARNDLEFDPMKDLNLPASYDEVIIRFKRLQGDRAQEVLN